MVEGATVIPEDLKRFAERYTAAWCSQCASEVAACYSPEGSLAINSGAPARGRAAIQASAQEFMSTFPDLRVVMDSVSRREREAIYRWTLRGTHRGPNGRVHAVTISGHEEWTFASDGLIGSSRGYFDRADYDRQLGI
jgi:hypothetical protein